MQFEQMQKKALAAAVPRTLSSHAEAGNVGAALLTAGGNLYTGANIDTACAVGFCAEHAAAAAMITAGESEIIKMVAVKDTGEVVPPCGRCREFISQLNDKNFDCQIKVDEETVLTLRALLPHGWRK